MDNLINISDAMTEGSRFEEVDKYGVVKQDYSNLSLIEAHVSQVSTKLFADSTPMSLKGLFKKYFKGRLDKLYYEDDIKQITEMYQHFKGETPSYKAISKQGYVFVKQSQLVVLIGSSTMNQGIYFIFTDLKKDMMSGYVYLRKDAMSRLVPISSFDINAYITRKVVRTDKVTGESRVMDSFDVNPKWLENTIGNMELHIFKKYCK